MLRGLAILACVLTIVISASSAFIRHSQALAGCPPGQVCAASSLPASGAGTAVTAGRSAATPLSTSAPASGPASATPGAASTSAQAALPGVRVARTLHRVSASAVGILVLWLAVAGWSRASAGTRAALVIALVLTAFLAWLGRYTPHGLPLVTLGNLLGGISLAAALGWIAAAPGRATAASVSVSADVPAIGLPVVMALVLFAAAAWLGTMIQAHGAISACRTLNCAGGAHFQWSLLDPGQMPAAIDPFLARGLHWLHRIAAGAFAVAVLTVAVRARGLLPAAALIGLLVLQIASGARATVVAAPIVPATAHNVFAGLLVVALVVVAAMAARPSRPRVLPLTGT